ncbi:MAG: ubiquinol-cytochrome c reductase iron-sulfur subunit [Terracidiphilus sp.]|nr:ubiquinol-cytochrome c reductase iron-sulfur subunit [Terracidiphilus sp.]
MNKPEEPRLPQAEAPAEWLGTQKEIDNARSTATTRRSFLFKLAVGLNVVVGAVLATPIIGFLLGPAMKKEGAEDKWIPLGDVASFPVGETRLAEYVNPITGPSDGDTAKTVAWVRHVDDGTFQVFAVNCAHLGCPVRWFEQSKLFLCPCHGGAYYADGSRASGPPERGLFEYLHRIDGGKLMIRAGQLPTLSTEACAGKGPKTSSKPRQDLLSIQASSTTPSTELAIAPEERS